MFQEMMGIELGFLGLECVAKMIKNQNNPSAVHQRISLPVHL